MGVDRRPVPSPYLHQGGTARRGMAAWRDDLPLRGRGIRRLMPRLGAHMSIAGGLPRAVDRAKASRCEALQIFTKAAGQWRARELPADEIALFRRRVDETGIHPVVAPKSYLIN